MRISIRLRLLVGLGLLALSVSDSLAIAPTISVTPMTPTTAVGNTLIVNVDVTGVTDLYGFQFDLGFNPSILSAKASNEGTLLPSGGTTFFIPGTIDNIAGSVTSTADTLLTAVPGVNGSGLLATLDFTAVGAGSSALTLANVTLVNSQLDSIAISSLNGSVTVTGTAVPEPGVLELLALGLAGICLQRLIKRAPVETSVAFDRR